MMHDPTPPVSRSAPTFTDADLASAIICYTRCYPCMFQMHPGGWHTWADPEDVLHGFITRHVDVRRQKCGCDCTHEPVREPCEPDWDEPDNPEQWPCEVCGEFGACAYDDEARPLVHVIGVDDELPT